MKKGSSKIIIECIIGDIANQKDMIAVVNAANAQLRTGGGVAGAIHKAAGPELEEEGRSMAPIKPGQAVITGGYRLPNKFVIHCLGPVYGIDNPEDMLLANCYRNALQLADQHRISSIAFPAISTGIFGYPVEEATQVVFRTIKKMLPKLTYVKHIRFVLYDESTLEIYEKYMEKLDKQ